MEDGFLETRKKMLMDVTWQNWDLFLKTSDGIYESYEIENLSTGARSWVHVEDAGHGQHFVNCMVQFIGRLLYN